MNEQSIQTLTDLIRYGSREYPEAPALAYVSEDPWSYRQFYASAAAYAKKLISLGIRPGDRVALLSESSPFWGIAYFAGVLTGAIMVPVLPDFHENEIERILEHSGASILLVSEKLEKKAVKISRSPQILINENEIQRIEKAPEIAEHEPAPDDTLCIIYTSGTTGNSKGVVLTHRNVLANAFSAKKIPHWTEETKALSVLPLAHTYEFTIGFIIILLMGGTIYYMRRPPSSSVLIPALAKVRPQIMLSVPLLIEKIHGGIKKTKIDSSFLLRTLYRIPAMRRLIHKKVGVELMKTFGGNLHFFGIGGAPLSVDTEQFLRETSFPFAIGYGLTETSPLIAGGNSPEILPRSTGHILDNVQCRLIKDPESRFTDGEVFVKGPSVMSGYYKDEERTKEVLSEDGWFRTGDLGTMSEDGCLTITGRAKTMILGANGENIYPENIEHILNSDQYVAESLVMQDGKTKELVAKVHLDYDQFLNQHKQSKIVKELQQIERHLLRKEEEVSMQDHIDKYISELKHRINKEMSSYTRISLITEQKEPFERTPTMKIKRYLYES